MDCVHGMPQITARPTTEESETTYLYDITEEQQLASGLKSHPSFFFFVFFFAFFCYTSDSSFCPKMIFTHHLHFNCILYKETGVACPKSFSRQTLTN